MPFNPFSNNVPPLNPPKLSENPCFANRRGNLIKNRSRFLLSQVRSEITFLNFLVDIGLKLN